MLTSISRKTQSLICMILSAVIVSGSLSLGAFAAGGSQQGNSSSLTNNWEFTNTTLFSRGKHGLRWGGRVRHSRLDDTSVNNFAGTYVFYSLAQYKAVLMQLPDAGASQFSRAAGTPEALVRQTDAGLFVTGDWRTRPNLTLSFGLRYEVQSNLGGRGNWAPRIAIAWGLDARSNRPAKTVVRAGFGTFFERIPLNITLNSLRYDGVTQQSYLILEPGFFPVVPPVNILEAGRQSQQLRPVFRDIQAPRLYQGSLGIERGLNQGSRLSLNWITSRGVHLLNLRNTNAPIQGNYPAGDRSIRLLTESSGLSRLNQLVAGVNATYRKLFFYGSYTLSYGMANNEGIPADPYDLRAEWSPSSYGDVRHRSAGGATIPLPRSFSLSAFLLANSGQPYNITTGLDPYQTGFPAARPALLADRDAASCRLPSWKYASGFGCFDLDPAPGVPTIGRNWTRGPSAMNYALRLSHTWTFGPENGGSLAAQEHSGQQSPMSVPTGSRKYNIVISASTLNALNHPNFAPPNGVLTSPYFGQYRALGGLAVMSHGGAPSTYNRKIDLQLRFAW